MNKQIIEKIQAFISTLEIENVDLSYYINRHIDKDFDIDNAYCEIEKLLQDEAFNVDIIGYYQANEYLMKHDTNLRQSHALAKDGGHDLNTVDIETLASILASHNARNDFYELKDEIEEFFERIVDEVAELEDEYNE